MYVNRVLTRQDLAITFHPSMSIILCPSPVFLIRILLHNRSRYE